MRRIEITIVRMISFERFTRTATLSLYACVVTWKTLNSGRRTESAREVVKEWDNMNNNTEYGDSRFLMIQTRRE